MAPLRYRSTGLLTRSNQPATKGPTRQNTRRPMTSMNQAYESSHSEHHDEADFEPDLNELFIQSIEELLPEQDQNAAKSATPAPPPSLERSPITPGTPIKFERDSLTDIYDTSPQGYVYGAADLGRRRTSKSTAQLTTPASSPERKPERRQATGGAPVVKSEVNHESDARQSVFDRSCTPPASSPEGGRLLKKPASKRLPTTPQRSPLGAFRAPANNQGIRESFSRAEGYLTTTILPQMPTTERHSGHLSLTISNRQPYGLSAKTSKAQENCEEPGPHVTLDGKSTRTGYPTTLPPPKLRPSTSKITTPTPGPVRTVPTHPSTAEEPLLVREHTTKGRSCCRLMCSQCTPKDVWEEYGLGPPDKRLNIPRLKSMSAYPSSVSSLGPDDDIPLSNKMHREAGRAVAESTKTYASGGLSEISPSPRYSDLLARLGISRPSPTENENRSDVYDDFEGDSLPQKDPCRVIFGKAGKAITDLSRSQHSHNVEDYIGKGEKKLQQIPGRPLRSFSSANDLSKKSQNLDQEISQGDADNSSNEASNDPLGKEDRGEDVDSGSEYEERASRIASNRAPPGVKSSSQSIKRAREVIDEWQPTFSDDEDMADEDDIIEINQDVFELSESRRKKRHKSKLHDANRNLVLASLVLKEEQVTENEDISSVTQNARATKVIGKNSTDSTDQGKTPCDYYMNTYWEHGRASDGRRARDAFVSYADFKKYCGKNNQPTDNRCLLLFKKDLKHYLLCEHHASLRQDLFRAAWNFEYNPGFSFKSCSKDEETRRCQNEAIGNAPSPGGSSKGSTAARGIGANVSEEEWKVMIAHAETVDQENKKLRSMLKDMRRKSARRS